MSDAGLETPCVACGLCCDGTLYARARVREGEEERIANFGLSLETFDGKRYFQLPCKFFDCNRCSIYAERFATCRSFECDLLRRVKSGAIAMDQALETVAIAKKLLADLLELDPDAKEYEARWERWTKLNAELKEASGDARREIADRQLRILALDTFLERHFRNKKRAFK